MYKSLSKIAEGFSDLGSDLVTSVIPDSSADTESIRKQVAAEILDKIHDNPDNVLSEETVRYIESFK